MQGNKLTEFVTVLVFAMIVGSATMLSIMNLEGVAQVGALIIILIATIVIWQYLRKQFGRG